VSEDLKNGLAGGGLEQEQAAELEQAVEQEQTEDQEQAAEPELTEEEKEAKRAEEIKQLRKLRIDNPNHFSFVKSVIAVVSGKGGVGKSLVTAMMSVLMKRKGYQVSIIDADFTGPSIPRMFGVKDKAIYNQFGIVPGKSESGIQMMSVNMILDNETDPVLWRGSVMNSALKQFWTEVVWRDVDFMFVDMPPGTGDVPLTVFQVLPIAGIIVVASPQELVSMVVSKAVKMAEIMDIPVIGIVENMSYLDCPDCGKQIKLFGESHIDEISSQYQLSTLGKIPIDTKLAALCDSGEIEKFEGNWLDKAAEVISKVWDFEKSPPLGQ